MTALDAVKQTLDAVKQTLDKSRIEELLRELQSTQALCQRAIDGWKQCNQRWFRWALTGGLMLFVTGVLLGLQIAGDLLP